MVVTALSRKIVCARLKTASRSFSGRAAHSFWTARAVAYAASMSAGVDCGSSTRTSPV